MKKCLVVLMALVLAFAACSMVVAAAPSKEGDSIFTGPAAGRDTNGRNFSIRFVKLPTVEISPDLQARVNELKKENSNLVDHEYDELIPEGDLSLLKYPITFTVPASGLTAKDKGYFLIKKSDGTIVELPATISDGKASFTITEENKDFLQEDGTVQAVFMTDSKGTTDIGTPEQPTRTDDEKPGTDTKTGTGTQSGTGTKTDDKTSDKTSDGVLPFMALMMMGAVVLGVSAKKVFVK